MFYPLLFRQNLVTLVWGTEDWTVSSVPDHISVIQNGAWAGLPLSQVIECHPQAILGKDTAARYSNRLPLLAKIIDAHQDLSIQVHPDDAMAALHHNKSGKSEMWYILEAEDGAHLYAGFSERISPDEYERHVADGSITEVLASHTVRKGDVFYLPAGRVHAICGGIRLVEIQQSSDVTYRIYDYDRPGLDGRPRQLHTALAREAIDFNVYPNYKTESRLSCYTASQILDTTHFSVNIVDAPVAERRNMLKYDSFVILVNIQNTCRLRIVSTSEELVFPSGATCLIPAAIADYEIIPSSFDNEGCIQPTRVLEAFINNYKTVGQKLSDFLHLT